MSRKVLQRAISMLTKSDLKYGNNIPEWLKDEYSYWEKVVSDKNFPCHFGTIAEKKGDLRYFYIENHDLSPLPNVLREFLKLSRENEHNKHALVVFVQPEIPEQSFDYYENYFWNMRMMKKNGMQIFQLIQMIHFGNFVLMENLFLYQLICQHINIELLGTWEKALY